MAVYYGTKNGTFNTKAMEITIPPHLNIPRSKLTFQKTAESMETGVMDIVSLSQDGFIQTVLGHQNGRVPSGNLIKGIKKEGDKSLFFPVLPLKKYDIIKALYDQSEPSGYKSSQIQLVDMNVDRRADLLAIKNNGQYVILYAGE